MAGGENGGMGGGGGGDRWIAPPGGGDTADAGGIAWAQEVALMAEGLPVSPALAVAGLLFAAAVCLCLSALIAGLLADRTPHPDRLDPEEAALILRASRADRGDR